MNSFLIFSLIAGAKYQPFIVFSVFTNGKELFCCKNSEKSSSEKMNCIEGIRVLSTMLVVCSHLHIIYRCVPLRNRDTYLQVSFEIHFIQCHSLYFLLILSHKL